MCGRVILLSYEELLAVMERLANPPEPGYGEQLVLDGIGDAGAREQARPGCEVTVLQESGSGMLEPRRVRWGIEAPWNGKLVYNTRIESALREGGMWAQAIRHGRCIFPVAAFFEPHATQTWKNPATGAESKLQYRFTAPGAQPLLVAGVEQRGRISVVTTQPNACVKPVHRRMPLIVGEDEVSAWLEGDPTALADRSRIALEACPEHPGASNPGVQQSLF